MEENKKVAMLIDSENVSHKHIDVVMKEAIRHGWLTIKRIYGDWTDDKMKSWKEKLSNDAIQPIQQFKNTQGKNSTDSALIIDAMDILHSGAVDSFILVSSDSDYTRLAGRLRESGKVVIGIGEKKTPKSLVKACDDFKYLENIQKRNQIRQEASSKYKRDRKSVEDKQDDVLLPLLIEAYDMIEQESPWKNLSAVANNLKKLDPSFDSQSYGFSKISKVFEHYEEVFELEKNKNKRVIFINKKDISYN